MKVFCLDLLQCHERASDTIVPCLPEKTVIPWLVISVINDYHG
jgi:hypothetical protein